jgi:hypothetical protein
VLAGSGCARSDGTAGDRCLAVPDEEASLLKMAINDGKKETTS